MKFTAIAALALATTLGACQSKGKESTKMTDSTQAVQATAPINAEEYKSLNPEGQQEVYDFLKATGTYYLATAENDQPRVRPFGTVNLFEGKLYIQTGYKKNVAKQIAANQKIELCAFNGKEWIRVAAKLVDDPRIEAKKSMLDAYPSLRGMYNENDGNTAVFFLTEAEAKICSFGAPEKVVKF